MMTCPTPAMMVRAASGSWMRNNLPRGAAEGVARFDDFGVNLTDAQLGEACPGR